MTVLQYYFDREGRRYRSQKEAVSVIATAMNVPGYGDGDDSDYDGSGSRKRAKTEPAAGKHAAACTAMHVPPCMHAPPQAPS